MNPKLVILMLAIFSTVAAECSDEGTKKAGEGGDGDVDADADIDGKVAIDDSNWESQGVPPEITGTEYYVDDVNGDDSNAGTSPEGAWQTISAVTGHLFSAGDGVLFKKGGEWVLPIGSGGFGGGFTISSTGLIITSYGEGDLPVILGNADEEQGTMIMISGNSNTVDGLMLQGAPGTAVMIMGDDNTLQNCDIVDAGMGVAINGGTGNLITHNYIHDLHLTHNDDDGDVDCTGGTCDDVGAVGVLAMANDVEISYNRFVRCKGDSYDYGPADDGGGEGGATETVGGYTGLYIHHNYAEDNVGFYEASSRNESITDVVVAYNVLYNTRWLYLLQNNNTAFGDVFFDNNTVLYTADAVQPILAMFLDQQTALPAGSVIMRNNLVVYETAPFQVIMGPEGMDRENNLYAAPEGVGTPGGGGIAVVDSELQATAARFVDMAGGDFHLSAKSPAVDKGIALKYTVDFENNPVPAGSAPDIGAFEYQP